VNVRVRSSSIKRRNDMNSLVPWIFHAARMQIGKTKRVSKRKIIDNPSAPKVKLRLYCGRISREYRNWNPTAALSNDKQLTVPMINATKDVPRLSILIAFTLVVGRITAIAKLVLSKITRLKSG